MPASAHPEGMIPYQALPVLFRNHVDEIHLHQLILCEFQSLTKRFIYKFEFTILGYCNAVFSIFNQHAVFLLAFFNGKQQVVPFRDIPGRNK